MRILVSTSTFPVTLDDGIPRFVYDLADSLADHAPVTVLAPGAPNARKREKLGSVDVRRFSYFLPRSTQRLALREGMRDNLKSSWLAKLQVPCFVARQALATRSLAQRQKIDVVNAHWLVPQGLTAAWACGRRKRFKLLLHVHAGDVYLLRKLRQGRKLARYVIRRTDGVFADGSHVRASLDELLGFSSNAKLQPMGVHRDVFGRIDSAADSSSEEVAESSSFPEGFILCFGRMAEKKGMIYLVRAMPQICERFPGLGLVLIGSGPEESRLRQEVKALGLENVVRFVGRKPHAEIVRYLHQCRVAVVPSIIDRLGETEGMPTVVVEAMAAGVPVVGSRVDGIPDVIRSGKNGWLCREKDPQDLADKILSVLNAKDQSAVIKGALETARLHDWKQVAENYMSCLRNMLPAATPCISKAEG